ncbi:MAG: mechanosensitive ion channel family protein [Actinobacteria bacterium]|nr:mechanosensitive ion channel family protein [Actinomycetota bacterium]
MEVVVNKLNLQNLIRPDFYAGIYDWLKSAGIEIAVIIVVGMALILVVSISSRKITRSIIKRAKINGIEIPKRLLTIARIVKSIVIFTLAFLMLIMVLDKLGVNIIPILAGAGVLGLAIGFGAQSLVKDIISGFFILMENQFAIGDKVIIDGSVGVVESMTLRLTTLRLEDGSLQFIPNSNISKVINKSKDWAVILIDVNVPGTTDIEIATEALQDVIDRVHLKNEFKKLIIDSPTVLEAERISGGTILLQVRAKVKPETQDRVKREFNKNVKFVFDERGIEII